MSEKCKLIINDPNECVDENLAGFVLAHSNTSLLKGHRVVIRRDIDQFKTSNKVAVISGGGSGHEPVFAGYVGKGGLTAAVAGSVFASPPPSDIVAAIRTVQNPRGVVVIVINYTGDRLNFGMAVEQCRANNDEKDGPLHVVTIGEDYAVRSPLKSVGRRGLAGGMMIIKMCCALAELDYSIDEIVTRTNHAIANVGTIGVALSSCALPGANSTIFELGPLEAGLGLGVHGEAGVRTIPFTTAKETVDLMIDYLTDSKSDGTFRIKESENCAVLLNNLGTLSQIEMNILCREVLVCCASRNINVTRFYVGAFMTSLNMQGLSISILRLDTVKDALLLLDCHVEFCAWPGYLAVQFESGGLHTTNSVQDTKNDSESILDFVPVSIESANQIRHCILKVCSMIIENSEELDMYDRFYGDGDCGSTMMRGGKALKNSLNFEDIELFQNLRRLFLSIATIFQSATGGTTGAIYGLFFTALADKLSQDSSPQAWLEALENAIVLTSRYSLAQRGDCTLVEYFVIVDVFLIKMRV